MSAASQAEQSVSAFDVAPGSGPVILAQPHCATKLPTGLRERLSESGRQLADTDWHIDRLYEGLLPDATVVRAGWSRVVIDCNRDPTGDSLYPGQNTTGLCPLVDFEGRALYRDPAHEPDAREIAERRHQIHAPYHRCLTAEIRRLRERHPHVLVFDCHSIRSQLPFLFRGTLPLFNLGTFDGRSCHLDLREAGRNFCREQLAASEWVLDGRFKGGYTVRHHAEAEAGVHCFQLELAQRAYLEEESPPWRYSEEKAAILRPLLASLLARLLDTLRQLAPIPEPARLATKENHS